MADFLPVGRLAMLEYNLTPVIHSLDDLRDLNALGKRQGKPVQFFGINTRDDAAGAAEAFERRFGVTYPSFRDPDGSLQLVFRTTLPPKPGHVP